MIRPLVVYVSIFLWFAQGGLRELYSRHVTRLAKRISAVVFSCLLAGCGSDLPSTQAGEACLDPSRIGQSVVIAGADFQLGDNRYYADERPARRATVADFEIDLTEVTNRQFAAFVDSSGYKTDAERGLSADQYPDVPEEYRVPGSVVFLVPENVTEASPVDWWQFVKGASWRHPLGPDSSIRGMDHYPVVQVTHADAKAYAQWSGRRLPTELEWEFAARGGLDGATYAWGNKPPHEGAPKANTWQGHFPFKNLGDDGFSGAAPVGCFAPNGYGLLDMTGNLWEWTATPYLADRRMPSVEQGYDPRQPGVTVKTIKGGSFLCADNYCQRYRPSARQGQDVTLASSHIGFRTAANIERPALEVNPSTEQ